jgi:hypothetical protein
VASLTSWLYRYRITTAVVGFLVVLLGGGFTFGLLGVAPMIAGEAAAGFAYLWLGAALLVGLVSEAVNFTRKARSGDNA